MSVVVGVQARLSSTRLPRKVLMDLGGRTMLQRVLENCWGPWQVVVLTSNDPTDDGLELWLEDQRVDYRRGSLENVLSRYTALARELQPSVLVRVCGDAPFLQKRWIARAVDEVEDKKTPCYIPGALHAGTVDHWNECEEANEAEDREHAGNYWFETHGTVLRHLVPDSYFSVNTEEDLNRARIEFERRRKAILEGGRG